MYRNGQALLIRDMHLNRKGRSKENGITNTEFVTVFLDLLVLSFFKKVPSFLSFLLLIKLIPAALFFFYLSMDEKATLWIIFNSRCWTKHAANWLAILSFGFIHWNKIWVNYFGYHLLLIVVGSYHSHTLEFWNIVSLMTLLLMKHFKWKCSYRTVISLYSKNTKYLLCILFTYIR